ncbi:RICIN domain-containing protein [Pokkaliibacter plantistimulans]|uniref:RICIN domain-containing protein n=1 Tax=Pokkaliibacter plantistimulans TaxID=1635171 RepID=UPI000D74D601|nr:RICIN domain-containing protein [Pokkaliibacter plantistimulans]
MAKHLSSSTGLFSLSSPLSRIRIGTVSAVLVACLGYGPTASAEFTHPGLLLTEADFTRIKTKVQAQQEPWYSAWVSFTNDTASQLRTTPAPLTTLVRGGEGQNFGRIISQIRFMYAMALRWKISGDTTYANAVVNFMNGWSSTLQEVTGNADRFLAAGIYGYELANIGEIMRTYEGLSAADLKQYQDMLVNLFYPLNHQFLTGHNGACISNYWANWDMANIAGMMSIGIFADRQDIYDEAMAYLHNGEGNGALKNLVYYRHPGNLGQYQESGRDQGHTTLGVSLFGVIGKTALNQGVDLFSYNNYELLAAAEYIAKYNHYEDVPYTPYGANCTNWTTYQGVVSDNARGNLRPSWELIYNYYANKLGMAAPWAAAMAAKTRPEAYGNGDELGWGTLTETLDPHTSGGAPRGLTADSNTHDITLSWWGAVGASSYNVKRATSASGDFITLANIAASDSLTYQDTAAQPGQTYFYLVTAISDQGESAATDTVSAATGTHLKFYLSFDQADGTAVANEAGSSSATLMNGATLGAGVRGKALVLDGVDDYVQLPDDAINGLTDYTIAFWFKQSEARTWARAFDFGNGTQQYLTLIPRTNTSATRFTTTRISGSAEDRLDSTALPVGSWVHVAVSVSGTTAVYYLNGTEMGRNEAVRFNPKQLGTLTNNWLGRSQYSVPYLKGSLDDFRIYSGALSATQIGELVNWDDQAAVANGTYELLSRNSSMALTTENGDSSNGTHLVQQPYSDADNQKWTITSLGNGRYKVMGVASGKAMDVSGAGTTNGTGVLLWSYAGSANQTWLLTDAGSGYYRISPEHAPSLSLDISGASTSAGTDALMWTYRATANQQWQLVKVE